MKDKTIIKVSVRSPLRLEISVHYYQPQSTMMRFDENLHCPENSDLNIGNIHLLNIHLNIGKFYGLNVWH